MSPKQAEVDLQEIEAAIIKQAAQLGEAADVRTVKNVVSTELDCLPTRVESGIRRLADRHEITFGSHFKIEVKKGVAA